MKSPRQGMFAVLLLLTNLAWGETSYKQYEFRFHKNGSVEVASTRAMQHPGPLPYRTRNRPATSDSVTFDFIDGTNQSVASTTQADPLTIPYDYADPANPHKLRGGLSQQDSASALITIPAGQAKRVKIYRHQKTNTRGGVTTQSTESPITLDLP